MLRKIQNYSYESRNDPCHREMYSADGSSYIDGVHGSWNVHWMGIHIASFFRREFAREFIRQLKLTLRNFIHQSYTSSIIM